MCEDKVAQFIETWCRNKKKTDDRKLIKGSIPNEFCKFQLIFHVAPVNTNHSHTKHF